MNFKVIFLDIDPVLTHEWEKLLDSKLRRSKYNNRLYPSVVTQSITSAEFTQKFDCIVSPGNAFARMEGGLDLLITRFFTGKHGDEKKTLKYVQDQHHKRWRGLQPVGSCYLIDMLPHMNSNKCYNRFSCRYIAHSPTMRVPSRLWRYDIIYDCMWSILNEVYNHNVNAGPKEQIQNLVVSGLGTGTGEMNKAVCAELMIEAYVQFLAALDRTADTTEEWQWVLAKELDDKSCNFHNR
ncbi:hypothetical protein V1512DRAFT_202310 [Lipomyces arxii]|uniref:uncharacterized protein n=1 Tax=Lipomyces arxii TaxID=56418 RepID=UPI0034CEA113